VNKKTHTFTLSKFNIKPLIKAL